MPDTACGIGVSPGRTAGPLHRLGPPPRLPSDVPHVADRAAEAGRAAAALSSVAAHLEDQAGRATAPGSDVLRAQALMARDPVLADAVASLAGSGRPAAWAVTEALDAQQEVFSGMGGYFAERCADLLDIRDRVVADLLGVAMPGVPDPGEPFVLVADDLSPADTAVLDVTKVLALVTRRGGPTSHTAILAKALGLPAVVACADVPHLVDGAHVSVDGSTGEVHVVSADEAVRIRARATYDRRRLAALTGPGRTADGHQVGLLLNVGSAADLAGVPAGDLHGVGLVRTEFLFLGRTEAPDVDEQERAYRELFEAAHGRKVVLRTLDAGADKPLPFLGLAEEENPALGVRGLRVARRQPEVLEDQLAAVAKAAAATSADVWVMAPMVATRAEAEQFAAQVRTAGLPVAGAMVEVPGAALQAHRLLEVVDFLSIGTNDLSQYTMATDRMCGELADLLDPWQPALLQLVAACARAGAAAGKPVGVCGEAASDPLLALVLTGLGVSTLSMAACSIPHVRAALAVHSLAHCQELATLALDALDATGARSAVAAGATSAG